VDDVAALIRGMPKAELHLHIEGTLEPELKLALAARNGVALPYDSIEALRAAYDFDDLPSFLAVYYEGMSVLLHEPDFHDLAMAYFRKAASQHVVYAEVFFDPQAHTTRGIAFGTVMEGLRRAQLDAQRDLGLRTQLIMCFLRDLPAESAMDTLERSMAYRDLIVGVGLDSDEKGNPPVKFEAVFRAAREAGYRLTMHCDVDQQDSLEHIRQCLDVIGVERIDHGVNALEDEGLVADIVRGGLGLTVCPISNSHVTDGLKADAIREMLRRSMRVTINSDDPAYFPGYMTENLLALHDAIGLTREEALTLMRNAFMIAWLPEDDRAAYLASLEAYAGQGW
jgi:adenosine deaminase